MLGEARLLGLVGGTSDPILFLKELTACKKKLIPYIVSDVWIGPIRACKPRAPASLIPVQMQLSLSQ